MKDLADGETFEMQGSGSKPYVLKNVGGVYSCSCPAWRNQSMPIERRTCKHLRKLRGDAVEVARIGTAVAPIKEEKKAPALLLAEKWDGVFDPAGWWMSEKLDGVRAFWDGKQFWSRLGNTFHAPDWFIAKLPKMQLDGELWLGRKLFSKTVGIVRRQDKSEHWKDVKYLVFDAPDIDKPFEIRLERLKTNLVSLPYVSVLDHYTCKGIKHVKEELSRIEGLGGEGLMLRKPGSMYEPGRSATLQKVKNFHDAEARVIGHLKGTGKHKGRMGSLTVELIDGKVFSVGTGFSDVERENPPAIGSLITFSYQEMTDAGVPRFPAFVRVCEE